MLIKSLVFTLVIVIISTNLHYVYAEIFYPTTNVRLKGPSTFCTISNIDGIPKDQSSKWIKIVNDAVLEWENSLKDAESNNNDIWKMSVKEISSEDEKGCDIKIEFQDKPDLSDTVAGYFSWPPGKVVIYYLQPKLCHLVLPCYDDETLKSDDTIFAIAIHEIGHSLGLDHYVSDDNDLNKKWQSGNESPPSVMIPTIPRIPTLLQITDLDVQKVRDIYGEEGFYAFAKSTIPTPEPKQEPTPQPEPQPKPELPPEPIIPLTPFDAMSVSKKIIEIDRYGREIITLSGKISESEFHRGLPVIITIHRPDDSVEVLKIKTTGDGYFETLLILDRNSIRGTYHISASYTDHVDKNMDVSFQVIDGLLDTSTGKTNSTDSKYSEERTLPKTAIIPEWIKNNAGWWAKEKIGDHAFLSGLQYLIKEDIIQISNNQGKTNNLRAIPVWVKNVAGFWAEDKITDDEFVKGIEYLVQNGLIVIP